MSQPSPAAEPHATPHALPGRVLLATAAALLALTVATVISSGIDLGAYNMVLALAIAGAKASLVAAFFMHLRYERAFQTVVFVSAVLFAVMLVGAVALDSLAYQPDVRAAQAQKKPAAGPPPGAAGAGQAP